MPNSLRCLYIFALLVIPAYPSAAQNFEVRGKITEAGSQQPLIGVHITIDENVYGTISGVDGSFVFSSHVAPPFVLHISYVGFEPQEVTVNKAGTFLDIKMKEQMLLGQEVVVSASRVEESILRSPVSIEKMNLRDIQQVPAANFYDGLYQLKGVDMNVHGLTFRLPNTRGFNDYTNYRMNQIIDGVENIAPGLSFSAGNIFGLSQIDIESLEMVVGASSALYGPGGMNGTLLMKSKDPFRYQGLSVSAQSGIMHIGSETAETPEPMYDLNLRYAMAFSNRIALKITASFLGARDWHAADMRDRSDLNDPSLTRFRNPGYDGVNTYGDESLVSVNLSEVAQQVIHGVAASQGIQEGTPEYDDLYTMAMPYFPDQLVTRTGWVEKDMAGDHTQNIRLGGALHYFITDRMETVLQANYAEGTSVYTAQNRFSARNFNILSGKLEVSDPDFFIRVWGVSENSGTSYDLGGAALLINESWKPSEEWFSDYLTAYTQTALLSGNMQSAHQFARLVSDNRDPGTGNVFDATKPAFPLSGSEEFNRLMDRISSTSIADGGAMVFDQSKMFQAEGMYNFSSLIQFVELQLGISNRLYSINSNGTIFADEPGDPITINQFGAFVQANKDLIGEQLRITGAFRYDKNEFFKPQYTPRLSLILFLDADMEHSIRGTYQTAYRFPSIADQWVDINTGIFRTVGGLPQVQEKYNFSTVPLYPLSGRSPVKDSAVIENGPLELPELSPERVVSSEFGYKGLYLGKKLFIDAYAFYNKYRGFQATQLLVQLAEDTGTEQDQLFQTSFTTSKPVTSFGWAFGLDYMTPIGLLFRSNVAYNTLLEGIDDPGVEARFNTPDYRFNLSVGHFAILPNLGFNINFHWQNSFLWESGFGAGQIPAISTLDAQLTYKATGINTTIKIGGSNILNTYYTTSFGSAQIGGLYYVNLVYEGFLSVGALREN
jgi:outer membrane receptor for ferrienterochelin and colicin